MSNKLIISFEEYLDTVEKLAVKIHPNYKPTVLVGINTENACQILSYSPFS